MPIKCIDCKNCKNDRLTAEAGEEYCLADMWDRNDPEQDWLHADDDFAKFISKARFCSEYWEDSEEQL